MIPTNRVINDITSKIETIMLHYDSIAIYPIRELLKDEVSYFDEQDDKVVPLLQQGTEPLGSEAFISNIVSF